MDSWTLQGDNYSFLRSAPRTFTLCHRDGTPNHVEIFDIINAPTQRSAISETTCLCDIFGDEHESSISSSPAVEAFVPLQRELDGGTAASPLVDDLNESSGSYHTAPGSSEGEEGFEDSREILCSPFLQNESSERRQSESEGLSTGHPGISQDISSNLEQNRQSPVPEVHKICPPSDVISTGERTPSPGHKSPFTLSSEEVSYLSSFSVDKRCPPSPSNLKEVDSEIRKIIPTFKERLNSPSHQCLTPSPSSESRDCVSSSSPDSLDTKLSPEFIVTHVLPEQRNSFSNQQGRHLSEPPPNNFSVDVTESAFESRAILSSSSGELLSQSRETLVSPELKNRPETPDTQTSSPFPELGGRVSLPDLFSRGYTPETVDTPCTPELIPEPSPVERGTTTSPENQSARLLAEPVSTVSTPVSRYTPPSPVVPIATSTELVESSVSPANVRHATPSPVLPSALSPCKTGTRTPSPNIIHISAPPESRSQESSPLIGVSLPPSPEVRSSCSPTEIRYTAPSPEIRVTAPLPEVSRKEPVFGVEITSVSPPLEITSDCASSRSPNSSPHITGFSYTVVQPEDRNSPPFPELSHLSTPEPQKNLASPEVSSPTPSSDSIPSNIAESTDASQESSHITGYSSSILQPETNLSHHLRYQTPSPQPNHQGPSPELRYKNLSPEKDQSPSPQHRSTNLSPITPSPDQWDYQCSPATVSTEYHLQYTQHNPLLGNTPEIERDSSADIKEINYPTSLATNVSPSVELYSRGKSIVTEIQTSSPVQAVQSSVSTSPLLTEVNADSSLNCKSPSREASHLEGQDNLSLTLFSDQKQDRGYTCFQKDTFSNPLFDDKCPSPNTPASEDTNTNISPVCRATSSSPVLELENLQPQPATYPITSKSNSTKKSTCTPKHLRRQLSTKVRSENRDTFTDDMAHHVNRRRTPSPPLTRFTPVHIIAPEKQYRRWQCRSHSPSQVVAASHSSNLKKVTNRESPSAPGDNNSQEHWTRLGRQSEIETEIQPEDEREGGKERQGESEMERAREREEQVPEKGEGWQGDTSYRGEQVELSFNARNRKGPASRCPAPTSRETRQGLPAVHSYSESLLATRQLQQQQRLLRLPYQQESRGGGPSRQLQPSALQNKKTAPGRVVASRPSQSSSSSMGSEFDEADNEVKWFTDLAFQSLSSPEVDYLDMYNSSHRSSANISQPSTQESPAGLNASWPTYADFRASAPNVDNNELNFQQPTQNSGGLDSARRYEMGSFECVDVAVEREDSRKVRRGVPKRQIQLKRKHNTEGKQDESSENSSPGQQMMQDSPCLESHSRETFIRQHSTPAAIQECYPSEDSPELSQQNERKSKLQKSVSLDETCSKTKMATCLIKSVLSKKMQSVDKQQEEQAGEGSPACVENSIPAESVVASKYDSPKPAGHHLRSSLRSNCSVSSDGLPVRTKDGTKPQKSGGVRSYSRPSSSSSSRSISFSQADSEEADFQNRNATTLSCEMRSELKVPLDKNKSRTGVEEADDYKSQDERQSDGSASATLGVSSANEARQQIINREQEYDNTEQHKQLQPTGFMPKTQEITLKAVEKKKSSINVCLTPEAENKPEASSPDMSLGEKKESRGTSADEKIEEEDGNENIQVKGPIHKVRDVRRLVKNTYNLSFKAPCAVLSSDVNEERIVNISEKRREDIKEKMTEEVLAGKKTELGQERWREESKEKTEEDVRVEKKEEQKEEGKDLTPSPPIQSKGKVYSSSQPMQIQYKAVCWKEDRNKMPCTEKDSETPDVKPQASPRDSQSSSNINIPNYTTLDTVNTKPYQHDLKMGTDTQATPVHKQPVNEGKSELVRTDRKPPVLGSLPKLPSKEREVSTAVVLIRDGSSKTRTVSSHGQEEINTPLHGASSSSPSPISPRSTPGSSGHSVSMLLKEKGFHADIGAVMSDSQNATGRVEVSHKHVNSLEIPLQTPLASDGGQVDSHRERTFSSSSSMSGPSLVSDNTDTVTKAREDEELTSTPTVKDTAKQKSFLPLKNIHEQSAPLAKQKALVDFESVKRLDPTFPPRSPAIRRFRPQPIEVKSLSKETQKQEIPATSTGNNRPQTIEVKSIAKNSQKPAVPPKPSCKFKPADFSAVPNEGQKPSATAKPQGEERLQTIVVSSPTIYRKISNESMSSSNYTRKLAVSAVSSLKPPPSKTTATAISSLSNHSVSPSEASTDRGQQQQTAASPQTSRYTQRPATLNTVPASVSHPAAEVDSAPGPVSGPAVQQVSGPASASADQPSQSAVMDSDHQQQFPKTAYAQEPAIRVTSNNAKQPPAVSTTQVQRYTNQPCRRLHSGECSQRKGDLHYYASDDPPSYDERESFSPLILPDLTHRRSNRYQPSSCPHPCSCTAGCPSHPGLAPPHHHHSPHNLTPPAPPHSPGQTLPYQMAQPALRTHHHQPMSYQPGSPKSSPLGLSHPQALYQTLHQPPPCPPHPSLIQVCPSDRPLQPPQHIEPRRPPTHRSPQQPQPAIVGAPYNDASHGHSPGISPMDPQYMCGAPNLGPSYGSEYGGDSSSLYSESSYGQTPRRVLMDPETGKYFYIEVPVQPLRKMLFDPETGQYVEVLIPQQAMSHSGLYPPSAAPYPSLHNPSMYATAPQYMPYAAPPPPAHHQVQPQPPRYPEAPAAATIHPNGPGISYRNPSGQGSKPDAQNHPPLDQSYMESMYYVPTGMNANPNPNPPDYYHKHPPNLPPTGGKRS